jgi:hypothetical protein
MCCFFCGVQIYADIPLPGRDIAQSKGLNAGIGFGSLNQVNCKTLLTWASHANYSYNSFLSGGASIKFIGGKLDSANSLVTQRYSLNAKVMQQQPKYVLFIGPVFSFENTDLSELRKAFSSQEDEKNTVNTECRNSYEKIGSSIGYQSGAGFLITPNWAFNFGHSLDWTFKGIYIASFGGALAFNLRELFENLKNNTKNFWLSLEYLNSFSKNNASNHNIILGAAVGF